MAWFLQKFRTRESSSRLVQLRDLWRTSARAVCPSCLRDGDPFLVKLGIRLLERLCSIDEPKALGEWVSQEQIVDALLAELGREGSDEETITGRRHALLHVSDSSWYCKTFAH